MSVEFMFNPFDAPKRPAPAYGKPLNIETPLPPGAADLIRELKQRRGPVAKPWEWQEIPVPQQVVPDPTPPQPPMIRSVLQPPEKFLHLQ